MDHMAAALSKTFKSPVVDTIQTLPQHQQVSYLFLPHGHFQSHSDVLQRLLLRKSDSKNLTGISTCFS